ncbi:MAG: methyltransferase [Candidatus Diapherotrites archaeon]|nr:methyltransferase [Candidatus Diapherotrites archaeon]
MDETNQYLKRALLVIEDAAKEKEPYHIEIFDKRIIVYPTVHSPKYFTDTEFFAGALPIKEGERFLEIGCGTGVISLFACVRGAKEVVAVDINPDAVKNTGENLFFHGFGRKSKCLKSDLFSALKGEKFDTIFWNMPFHCGKKENLTMLQRAIVDPEYKSFEKFAKGVKKHLLPNGRVLIGFSKEIGDSKRLRAILEKNKYTLKIIANTSSTFSKLDNIGITFQIIEAKPFP